MPPQNYIITGQDVTDQGKIVKPFDVHFTKSTAFRVVHASGVWFGGDPQQNLHLSFFAERWPIPEKIVLNLNPDGTVAGQDESKQLIKSGVIREVEVDVVFDVQRAVEFYKALGDNLKLLNAI